jgi:hypothetical protein
LVRLNSAKSAPRRSANRSIACCWNKLGEDFAGNLELRTERTKARDEVPKQARREHDQNEARHDGEVDLQIKPSHPSLPVDARSPQNAGDAQSWALANT